MTHGVDSLNVAAASAVAFYQLALLAGLSEMEGLICKSNQGRCRRAVYCVQSGSERGEQGCMNGAGRSSRSSMRSTAASAAMTTQRSRCVSLSRTLGYWRLHHAEIPRDLRDAAARLSAPTAAGVCPARGARQRTQPSRHRARLRLFLARGVYACFHGDAYGVTPSAYRVAPRPVVLRTKIQSV